MSTSKFFWVEMVFLLVISVGYTVGYLYPELLTEYFPKNKLVEETSAYGVWAAALSVTSLVFLSVPALKKSNNLYMLGGACTLFVLMHLFHGISVIPILYLVNMLVSQARLVGFSPNKSLKDAP